MRLLSVAAIGTQQLGKSIPYADIAKALHIDLDEVEIWVIDGISLCCPVFIYLFPPQMADSHITPSIIIVIRAGLVEAKLNPVTSTLLITYVTIFFDNWRQSLSDILQVIANAKLIAQSNPLGTTIEDGATVTVNANGASVVEISN